MACGSRLGVSALLLMLMAVSCQKNSICAKVVLPLCREAADPFLDAGWTA